MSAETIRAELLSMLEAAQLAQHVSENGDGLVARTNVEAAALALDVIERAGCLPVEIQESWRLDPPPVAVRERAVSAWGPWRERDKQVAE